MQEPEPQPEPDHVEAVEEREMHLQQVGMPVAQAETPAPTVFAAHEPAPQLGLTRREEEEEPMEEGEAGPECLEVADEATTQIKALEADPGPNDVPQEKAEEPMEQTFTESADASDQPQEGLEDRIAEHETAADAEISRKEEN
ncbi:neurofilament medium polypeptide-like [Colossoma macropomum]|nr:neurofilament medium polypeptide-like [Colossoma macropomum]